VNPRRAEGLPGRRPGPGRARGIAAPEAFTRFGTTGEHRKARWGLGRRWPCAHWKQSRQEKPQPPPATAVTGRSGSRSRPRSFKQCRCMAAADESCGERLETMIARARRLNGDSGAEGRRASCEPGRGSARGGDAGRQGSRGAGTAKGRPKQPGTGVPGFRRAVN